VRRGGEKRTGDDGGAAGCRPVARWTVAAARMRAERTGRWCVATEDSGVYRRPGPRLGRPELNAMHIQPISLPPVDPNKAQVELYLY
jgi:hypothetical protein